METIYENEGSEKEVLNQNIYQNDNDETNQVKDSIYQNENVGDENSDSEDEGVYNTPEPMVRAALNRAGRKVITIKRIEKSMRRTEQVSEPESDEENIYDLPDLSDNPKSSKIRPASASSKTTKSKRRCKKRYVFACIFCIFICIVSGFAVTLVLQQMPPDDPGV